MYNCIFYYTSAFDSHHPKIGWFFPSSEIHRLQYLHGSWQRLKNSAPWPPRKKRLLILKTLSENCLKNASQHSFHVILTSAFLTTSAFWATHLKPCTSRSTSPVETLRQAGLNQALTRVGSRHQLMLVLSETARGQTVKQSSTYNSRIWFHTMSHPLILEFPHLFSG